MRDDFKVIDADRHVLEPTDLFAKYLPAKFRGRVEIEGPEPVATAPVDGEPISDADQMRRRSKQEDYGFTFGASKRWRETFAERWRRNSTPRRTCATWIAKASMSACCFRPSGSTSCGATISIPS